MNILKLIGRNQELFTEDIARHKEELSEIVSSSSFLVIGGAGSIGQAVVKEIFKRKPYKLHVVDISENNMVELVRDIRSSYGYIDGDFQTFALDIGSWQYDAFIKWDGKYDYVLNLSALKHVRSEKDPFTLMRMIDVNIFNTDKTIQQSIEKGTKKYFCVSTDKAANPANMMGASKRIMEMFLMRRSEQINISTARFANVAFSDGSLLHGFNQRILKKQAIVAPNDVKRYFVIPKESGELCLMSCLLGENRDIFFPKLDKNLNLISFSDIAVKYLEARGFEPYLCKDEDEARSFFNPSTSQPFNASTSQPFNLSTSQPFNASTPQQFNSSTPQPFNPSTPQQFNSSTSQPFNASTPQPFNPSTKKQWPCLFTGSDTTGEKNFEEFFTDKEILDLERFQNLGVIKNSPDYDLNKIQYFESEIKKMKLAGSWERSQIVELFFEMIPDFGYIEKGKFLDGKM